MSILTVPDTYATIHLAYNAAVNGDTIYIKESGSPYNEGYMLTAKEVKFEGENTNVVYNSTSLWNFIINAHNIEITKLYIKNPNGRQNVYTYAGKENLYVHDCKLERSVSTSYEYIYTNAKDTRIEYNDFYGAVRIGIKHYHPTGFQKDIGNEFHGNITYEGILVTNNNIATSYNLETNKIENFGTASALGYGISFGGSIVPAASIIKGNTITGVLQGASSGSTEGIYAAKGNIEITENIITGAYRKYAVRLGSGCDNCEVHFNDFTGGVLSNALDDGTNNVWDKNSKGNYWGYGGEAYDSDGDAIGDSPYNIAGSANNQDKYPLMCSNIIWAECPYLALRKKWALGRVGVRFIRL